MYAKLVNGIIRSAPKQMQYNGNTIINPSAEKLLELGYKPVTYTNPPTEFPDGQHYESAWQETSTEIVQVWNLVENEISADDSADEISINQVLDIIVGGDV